MTQQEESIKYVMRYEKARGRKPIDVSKKLIGYDIKSGNLYIEVKSRPGFKIQPFVILHNALLRKLGTGLARYYIYLVYDMKKNPKLVIVPPEVIFKNLETKVSLLVRRKVYNKIKPIRLKIIRKQN
jgi:hypothetical protein